MFPILILIYLHFSPELQLQVMDLGLHLGMMLLNDELGGLQEFKVPLIDLLRRRAEHVLEQPVGDIDVGLTVGGGGVLLQDRRDGHGQLRILGLLLQPFIVAFDSPKESPRSLSGRTQAGKRT